MICKTAYPNNGFRMRFVGVILPLLTSAVRFTDDDEQVVKDSNYFGLLSTHAMKKTSPTTPNTIDDLAYNLFDGVDAKFQYCTLRAGTNISSLIWHNVTADLPWLEQTSYSLYKYAFVPGTSFSANTATSVKASSPRDSRFVGFCYDDRSALSARTASNLLCICGGVGLKGDDFKWMNMPAGEGVETMHFSGCKKTVNFPSPMQSTVELSIHNQKTSAAWEHPMSLWIKVGNGQEWCQLDLLLDAGHKDKSLAHGLAYCAVVRYVKKNQQKLNLTTDKVRRIQYFMYWAANYDQSSDTGWFKADQMRLIKAWANLNEALAVSLNRDPYKLDIEKMDFHMTNVPALAVIKRGTELCRTLRATAEEFHESLFNVYSHYMEQISLAKGTPPPGQKPIFVIAAGPPSSGKSLESLSDEDYQLICSKTEKNNYCPFTNRTYASFQSGTVQLNVDRLLEATDLSVDSKLYLAERKKLVQATDGTKAGMAKQLQMQQEVGQKDYWFLRKGAAIDDLSNAHIQLTLGMGLDAIYETLLGDGWLSWGLKFEIPKVKAAGYEILIVDYAVPFDDLVKRAAARQEATGQEPAPASQIRNDAKAAPTNFMKPALLKLIDFGITMTHVNSKKFGGTGIEVPLASFINRGGDACFKHCAVPGQPGVPSDDYITSMLVRCSKAKCS